MIHNIWLFPISIAPIIINRDGKISIGNLCLYVNRKYLQRLAQFRDYLIKVNLIIASNVQAQSQHFFELPHLDHQGLWLMY
jgi:hypothetical protein